MKESRYSQTQHVNTLKQWKRAVRSIKCATNAVFQMRPSIYRVNAIKIRYLKPSTPSALLPPGNKKPPIIGWFYVSASNVQVCKT